jgi:hypothetical protein
MCFWTLQNHVIEVTVAFNKKKKTPDDDPRIEKRVAV